MRWNDQDKEEEEVGKISSQKTGSSKEHRLLYND